MWIAECVPEAPDTTCNILDGKYLAELQGYHDEINEIVVDWDTVEGLVSPASDKGWTEEKKMEFYGDYGNFSYSGGMVNGILTEPKCYQFFEDPTRDATDPSGQCLWGSVLSAFGPGGMTDADMGKTDAQLLTKIRQYQEAYVNGTAWYPSLTTMLAASGEAEVTNDDGLITDAQFLFGFYGVNVGSVLVNGDEADVISDDWEKKALCVLGISSVDDPDCAPADGALLKFSAQFQVSLGTEFGASIGADISKVGISYGLIIVYLTIMLSRRDSVFSMMGMSIVTVMIVGMSYVSCMGLGAYIGVMNNRLTANIPFLLLGLGVDDAFVLASEFNRARKAGGKTIEEQIIDVAKFGGVSILITSVTDAAAFLLGATTSLPALGWFCVFAGIGVIFCFLFQLFFFLPCLCINAKREKGNRYDLCCCFTSKVEHDFEEPNGCCSLCKCGKPDQLEGYMNRWSTWLVGNTGSILACVAFVALFGLGAFGCANQYTDFQIEYFVPEGSYLKTFYAQNEANFASATPCSVYIQDTDIFPGETYNGDKDVLGPMFSYLNSTRLISRESDIGAWWMPFSAMMLQDYFNDGATLTREEFYQAILDWTYLSPGFSRFRGDITWASEACNDDDLYNTDACDSGLGIAATKWSFNLALEHTGSAWDRYDTMQELRAKTEELIPGSFPYTYSFLNWEETGVIGGEFTRNVAICAGTVFLMIILLIPHPRIALLVMLNIILSVTEVIGFMYWWNAPINGISTIYILISVGLVVDYSAHIGHMFAISPGSASERTVKSMTRIGPSVFNAVVSTLLAVIVIAFSGSYIFQIFFKALFLTVIIGGSHGLILLPVLLRLLGGSRDADDEVEKGGETKAGIQMSQML